MINGRIVPPGTLPPNDKHPLRHLGAEARRDHLLAAWERLALRLAAEAKAEAGRGIRL